MDDNVLLNNIRPHAFETLRLSYPDYVRAEDQALDHQRFEVIPAAVRLRGRDAHITKNELLTLVDWYMYVKSI